MTIGQVVVGTGTPDVSAALEIQGTDRGVLFPRLTTDQRNAIVSPAFGLMVLNTSTLCLEMNIGTPDVPEWLQVGCRTGRVDSVDCGGAVITGKAVAWLPVSEASFKVPYSGGNGGVYAGQTINSTNIYGLSATLIPGNLSAGSGELTYIVSGYPYMIGNAYFDINVSGQICNVAYPVTSGTVSNLDCENSTVIDTLVDGLYVSGLSVSIPYSGGDGGYYECPFVASTGVTGLYTYCHSNVLEAGSGILTFYIYGTPSGYGTAEFAINIAGQSCSLTAIVIQGGVSSLDCAAATVSRNLFQDISSSGASISVPYNGGNRGAYSGQTVSSTGVTGLTATLTGGNFANGTGNLTYSLSGTPVTAGTASFAIDIDGQICNLDVSISPPPVCRAKINATTYRNFMCHNLGAANTNADPFTPSWEINGGYWQWGRKEQAAAGPSGPAANQANEATVSGWNTNYAPDESWSDVAKSVNDPCPAGYRVPTSAQWNDIINNNIQTTFGTDWTSRASNYSTGRKFGNELFLPAAGGRADGNGMFYQRGANGYYWSSTGFGGYQSSSLDFGNDNSTTYNYDRRNGRSVRCIEVRSAAIGSLDCNAPTISGTLSFGLAATNVVASLAYTNGNGGDYNSWSVISTGVTGLTANLNNGIINEGNGNLSYTITGIPNASGLANFELNIGGQSCNLVVPVNSTPVCRAKIDSTTYKNFMCYNLGAVNANADPLTPSWEINGGYWQWGRSAQAAAGPSGPGPGQANEGSVFGWNKTAAPAGSWSDTIKTANDPCPSGFRVPTREQWIGIIANNTVTNLGTWENNSYNYTSGKMFGTELMLPAAGVRHNLFGSLLGRNLYGYYQSSTGIISNITSNLYLSSQNAQISSTSQTQGFSIRCIEE